MCKLDGLSMPLTGTICWYKFVFLVTYVQNCTFFSESDRHMACWTCICRRIPKRCQTHILARLPAVLAGLFCSFCCVFRKYMVSVWNRLQMSAVLYTLIIVNDLAFWFNGISCLQLCSWISSEWYGTCFWKNTSSHCNSMKWHMQQTCPEYNGCLWV
jgi:hypothetical protein